MTDEAPASPTYDLDSHRAAFREMRGAVSTTNPVSPPPPPPVGTERVPSPSGEPYQPPAYDAQSHKADLQALRGQPFAGAPYAAPPPVPVDDRSPDQVAYDQTHGSRGHYDLGGLEGAGDVAAALDGLNFHPLAGRSFVESFVTAGREYASLTEPQREEWADRQNEMLSRMTNSAQILADAKNMSVLIKEAAPDLHKQMFLGETMPFMTAVLLANQFQRLAHRTTLSKAATP